MKYKVIPEQFKLATLPEVMQYNSSRHEGCGKTNDEALKQLANICQCHNIPEPTPIPETVDSYYCGFINVQYIFKSKKRYNPVWFTKKNGMCIAFIYYHY